jgi:hypothetical protein
MKKKLLIGLLTISASVPNITFGQENNFKEKSKVSMLMDSCLAGLASLTAGIAARTVCEEYNQKRKLMSFTFRRPSGRHSRLYFINTPANRIKLSHYSFPLGFATCLGFQTSKNTWNNRNNYKTLTPSEIRSSQISKKPEVVVNNVPKLQKTEDVTSKPKSRRWYYLWLK